MVIYSKVSVAPSIEPISLSEAKSHLRVDHDDENSYITVLIQAARETVEKHTNRSLITQTRVMKMDYFPLESQIYLLNGPVQTGVTVQYYNASGVLTSFTDFWEDVDSDIARIVPEDYWPETYDKPNAVVITYDAGYGDASTNVPAPLRQAMLLLIAHFYENRQNVIVSGSPTGALAIPFGAEVLMNPYVLDQSVHLGWRY